MSEAPQLLLDHHLKTLRLPTFLRDYSKVARQCAADGLDHVHFLARLVELEMIDRERRMIERRIKAAGFHREVQRSQANLIWTSFPRSASMAWNGVL